MDDRDSYPVSAILAGGDGWAGGACWAGCLGTPSMKVVDVVRGWPQPSEAVESFSAVEQPELSESLIA